MIFLNFTLKDKNIKTMLELIMIGFLVNPLLSALIFIPGIPVNQLSLMKAQIALDIWEMDLNNNYGKPTQNTLNIKGNTDRVTTQLQSLSEQLSSYQNVIIGSSNQVKGNKNIIIGNGTSVTGKGNYIFSSGFNSSQTLSKESSMSNTLVSDNWIGELDKSDEIFTNLHEVIYSTN